MASTVVRPRVPYRGCIPNGLHEGKLIEIKGSVPYGVGRFEINFLTGLDPSSDRAFHMSVRFDEHAVVRNSLQQNSWGYEERQGAFPFHSGREFYMMILVEANNYRVAVDHQHCFEFVHRIPMSRVNSIYIDGSVEIARIEFIDKNLPSQPRTRSLPDPYIFPPDRQNPGFNIPPLDPYFCPNPAASLYPGFFKPGFPTTVCPPAINPGYPPTAICPPANPIPYQPGGCIVPPPEQRPAVCPQPGYIPAPATGNSNLAPVYNPTIPYAYPIYGGLKPGMMIYISGRPSHSPYKATINFQSGTAPYPPPDICFHFEARFFNRTVVRNSRLSNVWEREENMIAQFPFQSGVNFDMIIRVESDRFMVALNGQHFVEFRHRLHPLSRFDTLYIENDVVVSSIRVA